MKTLDEWTLYGYGISGVLGLEEGDSEDDIEKHRIGVRIRTSNIIHRDDNIVTTKSGTRYKLLSPEGYVVSQEIRDAYWGGAKTELEAVDYTIKKAKKDGT